MIKLFDGWVISADEMCYTLKQERGTAVNKKTGETERLYSTPRYYATIEQCANSLCRILQRKAVTECDYSPAEARTALNGIREDVITAFNGIDAVGRDLTEGESV
jgi:hypothetical protein